MKKKYIREKRRKITVTIDKNINDVLEEYIEDNEIYNKSGLVETLIKNQIKKDKDEKKMN
jgi:metal-responsive CopG/Arc/MetJ family transcriptional regulator